MPLPALHSSCVPCSCACCGRDTAASAVKKMKSMKTDNGRKKLVLGTAPTRPLNIHTDTERSLPTFMQGRVKDTGPVEAKLGQVGGGKTGKGRGRALPAKKIKDKKGAKYATGKGGTMDGTAVEAKRRGSDDFSAALDRMDKDDEVWRRSKRNPLTKFIQGRVRAYKRYMLLRKQAKTPVVLGDRAKAVTDALEMTQKHLKMMRAAFHEVDFSRMVRDRLRPLMQNLADRCGMYTGQCLVRGVL